MGTDRQVITLRCTSVKSFTIQFSFVINIYGISLLNGTFLDGLRQSASLNVLVNLSVNLCFHILCQCHRKAFVFSKVHMVRSCVIRPNKLGLFRTAFVIGFCFCCTIFHGSVFIFRCTIFHGSVCCLLCSFLRHHYHRCDGRYRQAKCTHKCCHQIFSFHVIYPLCKNIVSPSSSYV